MNKSIVQTLREVQLKDIVWTDRNLSKTPFHTAFWVQKRIGDAIAAHAHLAHGVLLDVGCGLKPYEKFFAPYVKKYYGTEYSPESGFRGNRADVAGDASAMPFADASVNTILCTEVLEHVAHPEKVIEEFARILKPDGVIITTAPFFYPIHDSFDFFRYTDEGIAVIMRRHGLEIEEIEPLSGTGLTVALMFNFYLFDLGFMWTKWMYPIGLVLRPVLWLLICLVNLLGWIMEKAIPSKHMAFNHLTIGKKNNMPPIKVLHLIPTLSSGGAERQLVNLIHNTSREIINHVVCVIGEADFFAPNIREANYKVVEMGIFAKHPFFRAALKFRQVVREEKPDIIHTWLYDANISARLASILSDKIPIVTSLQLADYEPEAGRIGNYNPHKVRALRAIDKFTSIVTKPYFVPCSYFVKNSYQRLYGTNEMKTQVIYNSVDPDLLAVSANDVQKIRENLGLSSDAFIYLNVGRLDPQKNHKVLFESFRQVSAEIPNAFLLLVGVGSLEKELKNLAENLEIDKKIVFLGRRKDVDALLELADVFVFPSFHEGLPVALVEAMFKSLPCIASRIEVFEEVISDGKMGWLIDPTSADELKDAMIELYKNADLRKTLGENAFQQAQTKFNAATSAGQWEKFYQKVKSESKTP